MTEGPYWVDEKLFRSDIRTDPSTGVARAGVPLTLTITVQNLGSSCTPLQGAYVDIWHCDAKGIYSDEATYNPGGGTGNVTTTGQKFLRGYQITDSNGQVTFTTIYPGWYSGRTIHIHMRVRTYSGSTVLSNFVTQIFFDDSITNTVLTLSDYSRTTARDTTNATDNIYNIANKTRMLATTTGDTASGCTATITVGAAFNAPAAATPAITSGGIANALSGAAGVAPGAWISLYGSNLSSATRALAGSDLVDSIIPATLGGVSVQVDGKAAFIQYVSPSQVNVLVPSDSNRGSISGALTNSAGTSSGVAVNMSEVLPGLAVLSNYVRAVRYPDGAIINGTGASETGYTTVATASPGDIVSLFGTGFGPAEAAPSDGLVFTGAYALSNQVTVSVGGASAEVLWAGLVGAGLNQINIRLPTSLSSGDQAVIATVAGVSSATTALIKIGTSTATSASRKSRRLARRTLLLPLTRFNRPALENIVSFASLYGPGQHPDAGMTLARSGDYTGELVHLG